MDSFAGSFTSLDCLGILPGSCCPHYDGEAGRRDTYHAMIESGKLPGGYAIDEITGLHFIGRKLSAVLTGKDGGSAYRVTLSKGRLREKKLPARNDLLETAAVE